MANAPVLIAYIVKDRPSKKSRWLRIGVAFPHAKGSGLTVILNALPLNFDGRIVLVEPKIDPEEFPPAIPPPADETGFRSEGGFVLEFDILPLNFDGRIVPRGADR